MTKIKAVNIFRYIFGNELIVSMMISFVSALLTFFIGAFLFMSNMAGIMTAFVLCLILSFMFIYDQKKSYIILFVCILLPLIVSALPFIMRYSRHLIYASLISAAVLLFVYITTFFKAHNIRKCRRKALQFIKGLCAVLTAAFLPAYSIICFFTMTRLPVISVAEHICPLEKSVIEISEAEWECLNIKERIDLLSQIAANEAVELGLEKVPKIELCILPEINGSYAEESSVIKIDIACLNNSSADKGVSLIAHELYHSYEHMLVSGNTLLDANEAEKAVLYKFEFEHYTDALEDYSAYYSQKCEEDARAFGQKCAEIYVKNI